MRQPTGARAARSEGDSARAAAQAATMESYDWSQWEKKGLDAELIAASSFQNAFANVISINAVRCHGQVICKEAESLSDHVSREISRTTSNNLAFLLNYTMWGELLQYIMMATLAIFISQGIIGAVGACQRNCCSKNKPQLSCCGLLLSKNLRCSSIPILLKKHQRASVLQT